MNADLKKRIPTAIAYVVVISGCLWYGTLSAMIITSILWMACQHEYLSHLAKTSTATQVTYLIVSATIAFLAIGHLVPPLAWSVIIMASLLFITIHGLYLLRKGKIFLPRLPVFVQVSLYLILPFAITLHMIYVSEDYNRMLLVLFVLIWINDAGAYFAGKAFGKHKLMPSVSPGKTWEGFIGGGLLTIAAGILLFYWVRIYSFETWLSLSILIFLFSVAGDLVESAWKRSLGIKDTGTILPGHGGFLDRLDSFIYCAPMLAAAIFYFEL